MTRGRRTDRIAYAIKKANLPQPLPGLRDPELKTVFKSALENGAEVVTDKHKWD
jgi:hypothetical protein